MNKLKFLRGFKSFLIAIINLPGIWGRRFTQRHRKPALILAKGGINSGSAWITERASRLGFKPIVVAQSFPSREGPWATRWKKLDFEQNETALVEFAKDLKPAVILSDHRNYFLPIKAKTLKALDLEEFGSLGPETSNNKLAFRRAIDAANIPNIPWVRLQDIRPENQSYPCVAKPIVGTGSRGVTKIINALEMTKHISRINTDGNIENWIVEGYTIGRQFDVEGVCRRGEFHILSVTEEHYEETDGKFPSSWFLFSPPIPTMQNEAIKSRALDVLKACGVKAGAFHVEMRLTKDGQILPIDYANRYGYPLMVSACADVDFIEAYVRTLLPDPFPKLDVKTNTVFQKYTLNLEEREKYMKLVKENPDKVIESRPLGSVMGGVQTYGRFSLKTESFQKMKNLLGAYDLVPNNWSDFYN